MICTSSLGPALGICRASRLGAIQLVGALIAFISTGMAATAQRSGGSREPVIGSESRLRVRLLD